MKGPLFTSSEFRGSLNSGENWGWGDDVGRERVGLKGGRFGNGLAC